MVLMSFALLMLPSVCIVSAFREHAGQRRFWGYCRSPKCNGKTYRLRGDLAGQIQFQDCEVNKSNPFFYRDSEDRMCEETCKVVHLGESYTVEVERKSGKGEQSCALEEGICEDPCCKAKCSGESYDLKAKWKGKHRFEDCQLQPGSLRRSGEVDTLCQETCTVRHSKRSQKVNVTRPSGPGQSQCALMNPDVQEIAMDLVKEMEKEALRLSTGDYGFLPIMKAWKIKHFLNAVLEEVLRPDMAAAGGHGYSREISQEVVQNVAIIGDLHGQLFNLIAYLLEIKDQYKDKGFSRLRGSSLLFCDPRMKYVFMGDYVDRGERGVELLMLVLAYKVRCPQGLIVLQGNHETPEMWERYGFAEELRYKFNGAIPEYLVQSVTETLPYVAVLPGHWVAMHGGISPSFVKKCSGKAGRFGSCLDRTIGESLVWADPHDGDGFIESNRGPGIYKFGMDIAEAFLESNGLWGLFRGHEQVKTGLTYLQSGKYMVVTVFSAADYVGLFCVGGLPPFGRDMFSTPGQGNDGAIFLLDIGGSSEPFSQALNMSGSKARKLARDFTGATCRGGGLIETSQTISSLESFIEENHKHLHHGNSSCSLDQEEAANFQEEVRRALTSSNDPEFEARKLIDLQGEALVHGMQESSFICKSMMKDHLTLKVYKELQVADAEVLEHDIETRRDELLSESTDVEA